MGTDLSQSVSTLCTAHVQSFSFLIQPQAHVKKRSALTMSHACLEQGSGAVSRLPCNWKLVLYSRWANAYFTHKLATGQAHTKGLELAVQRTDAGM